MTNVVQISRYQAQSRTARQAANDFTVQPGAVTVMTLPDGTELFMRATHAGWTVFDSSAPCQSYGTQRACIHSNDADAKLLADIAEAYGFGPIRHSNRSNALPALHKPARPVHLTLFSLDSRKPH